MLHGSYNYIKIVHHFKTLSWIFLLNNNIKLCIIYVAYVNYVARFVTCTGYIFKTVIISVCRSVI